MLSRLFGADPADKPKRPPNREIVFEILKMGEDGRWEIDTLLDDEEAAVAHAEALLGDPKIARVRVVRERSSRHGPRLTSTIYERDRTAPPAKAPITLSAPATDEAWCETPEDIFGDASRRMIGRLLRNFLDKHQATPTELLFDYRLYRRLDAEGSLAVGAVQRLAKLQAERRGLEVGVRARQLETMVSAAVRRAREHGAERRRPRFQDGDLAQLRRAAVRFAPQPSASLYAVQAAVAEALRQIPSLTGKLEYLLALESGEPADLALLDGLVADCLGSAQTVQDLLGRQGDLYSALTVLVQLATRQRGAVESGEPALLVRISSLIEARDMPATRAVLLDRAVRELAGERPLSRAEPMEQRKQLKAIAALLGTPEGRLLGGSATATALGRRARRLGLTHGFLDLPGSPDGPAGMLRRVLDADPKHRAEDAKLSLAAYALDAADALRYLPEDAAELATRLAGSGLPEAAKRALAARLAALPPRPASEAAPAATP